MKSEKTWKMRNPNKWMFNATQAFVDLHGGYPLKRQTVVTCITTLKKSHADETGVSCLVLGTESSSVYVLDPEAFTIMESMSVPSPPAHIVATGLYDVDFRIVTACRDGALCSLKRGFPTAKVLTQLGSLVKLHPFMVVVHFILIV